MVIRKIQWGTCVHLVVTTMPVPHGQTVSGLAQLQPLLRLLLQLSQPVSMIKGNNIKHC